MHPILSHVRRLLLFQCGMALVGILLAWFLVEMHFALWAGALLFSLPTLLLYGFMLTSAYYVCRSLPFAVRKAPKVVWVFGGATLFSALAWLGFCLLWNSLCHNVGMASAGIHFTNQVAIFLLCIGCVLYVISLLAHDVLIAFENIRAVERQQAATQVLARDAELQVLRSQINPHFLFNSLNSISALTAIDASAARAMVIELGSFFRESLALSAHTLITLGEELALCKHYLAIEKIRFDDRLQTSISVESEALAAKVPPMFLQPLVENAIKHGICNLAQGGTIDIVGTLHENWLYISVSNPKDSQAPTTSGTGTGLRNLKARLENLYRDRIRMTWHNTHENFRVEIIIPLETQKENSSL